MRKKVLGFLSLLPVLGLVSPVSAQLVINELLADPGSQFDGAEFIEIYNPTGGPVDYSGWVLTGLEFDGTCGGTLYWQFPASAPLAAGGFIVVAKDNIDAPGEEQDGFFQRYGFNADFEQYDADRDYEFDDPLVENMIIMNNEAGFDSQIRIVPGNGFGGTCGGFFNLYEALYLYDGDPGSGGTLIDFVEFRDSSCSPDSCDTAAFGEFPEVGEVICRDASGTDTDDSSVDFDLGTGTPKAPNIQNAGPRMSNLVLSNPCPLAGATVDVTITATDSEGIGSMWVVYTVNGGAADSSAMSMTGTDSYTGQIPKSGAPALGDGDVVNYFVRAYDAGSPTGFSKFPDYSDRAIRWGTQTITSIQFHTPASDTGFSAEVGNPVNIEGIVTTENGPFDPASSNRIFTVQSEPGFWKGVHVIDFLTEVEVQRGDEVRVCGTVGEYFNLTQVQIFGQEAVQTLSSSNPIPQDILTASQLVTGTPFGEIYEGGHVRLENVEVTLDDDGFGQFEVTDGTGTALIGDDAFYLYNPTIGDSLQAVQGIVAYSFSERKLEPRDDGDIIGPPIVSTLRYTPIPPPVAPGNLKITAVITDNGAINRAKLYYSEDNGASYDSLDMVNTMGDDWEADISTVTGPEIDYHIEVTDDTGFNGRAPSLGDFDLYRGLTQISTIQSTTVDGDSSSFTGSPRNVAGVVTQAPGVVADNIFTIQNTGDPAFAAIQVFAGGSVLGQISRGDSVAVSGDVEEFFRKTQIDLHFTDAYTNYGFSQIVAAVDTLDSTDLPRNSILSEPWESVLVQLDNSVVTNENAGFGQYYVDNTAPRNGEEALVDDEARLSGKLTYEPSLGDSITVRGILDFAFDDYKIQPRDDADILPYNPADAVGVSVAAGAPLAFSLHQNTPNPFTGRNTQIAFSLPNRGLATLRVFDVQGRLVRTLVSGPVEAGRHVVDWNGRNESDREVSTGVYFYRLQAEGQEATRKMILLR